MTFLSSAWRCILLLLSVSIHRCPLLLTNSQRSKGCGYLTVKPAQLFLLGSNLTIYCHNTNCRQWNKIFLAVDGSKKHPGERINSTTFSVTLPNVQTPSLMVLCRLNNSGGSPLVNGLSLKAGLPPEKPGNVRCETWRASLFLECSWERGRETHLNAQYNVSISREDGTPILMAHGLNATTLKVPQSTIVEDSKYQVKVTEYNYFGSSQSDPVSLRLEDMVVPEVPHIVRITFENSPMVALLQWNVTESSGNLVSSVRFRAGNGSWGEAAELGQGPARVLGLTPLTEYEFQVRACQSGRTSNPGSAADQRSRCSRWSPPRMARSPGRGPSQELHVWRVLGNLGADKMWNVTVLWKPPSPGDYSGEVQHYKVFDGDVEEAICPAGLSRYTLQVPSGLPALSISVVTLYGSSPPAHVPLRYSGESGALLEGALPADNGSTLLVSWSWRESGGEALYSVLEWAGVGEAELQWKRLARDQNSTSITGLSAGVRYKVSLYTVTSAGVSAPLSRLVYSREQKPVSGPSLSVLQREAGRMLVQWDGLPVDQQRGFITGYSIYLQTLDPTSTEHRVTVNGSAPGQEWLDCPDVPLVLQAAASTSAGEGLRGVQVYAPAADPPDDSFQPVLTAFVVVFFVAVIVLTNLMCLGCVQQRIKKRCLSWRPACLGKPLPKPGNSVAIRLLEMEETELTFPSPFPDPPLSPISLVSQEDREDPYPSVHVKRSKTGSGPQPAKGPSIATDPDTSALEHDVSYKPQTPLLGPQEEEAVVDSEEERWETPAALEEDRCSESPGGFLRTLLLGAEVDHPPVTLCSTGSSLWPPQRNLLQDGFPVEPRAPGDEEETRSSSLELRQGETMDYTSVEPPAAQKKVAAAAVYDGYFPQVAPEFGALCERRAAQEALPD